VDAPAQGVFFTGGATESNNQILRGFLKRHPEAQILCSAVEHPSVLEVVKDLAEVCPTSILTVDSQGRLLPTWPDLVERSRPFLMSVMWANNEIGNLYPIAELAQEVHALGGFLHVDATQALGRIPVSFQASGADFMSLSFHKMGGPKGVGAVVVREGLKVDAMVSGGHQERGRRPGTENVLGLAGLDAAMRCLVEQGDLWHATLLRKRRVFLDALSSIEGLQLRGEQHFVLPNTINAAFQNVDGEDLLLALDLAGLACSSGSACTAGSLEPSHVILAMGYEEDEARRSVRFSFGPFVEDEDLIDAANRIAVAVDQLRQI
jgi:cysteine desulfurase